MKEVIHIVIKGNVGVGKSSIGRLIAKTLLDKGLAVEIVNHEEANLNLCDVSNVDKKNTTIKIEEECV